MKCDVIHVRQATVQPQESVYIQIHLLDLLDLNQWFLTWCEVSR